MWFGSVAGCWTWMFFLQNVFSSAIPKRFRSFDDSISSRNSHLVLPFDDILKSIRSTANYNNVAFQNISNIFSFDLLEKYVRMNLVEKIHLRFRSKFLNHRALWHREYFVSLAENHWKKILSFFSKRTMISTDFVMITLSKVLMFKFFIVGQRLWKSSSIEN